MANTNDKKSREPSRRPNGGPRRHADRPSHRRLPGASPETEQRLRELDEGGEPMSVAESLPTPASGQELG